MPVEKLLICSMIVSKKDLIWNVYCKYTFLIIVFYKLNALQFGAGGNFFPWYIVHNFGDFDFFCIQNFLGQIRRSLKALAELTAIFSGLFSACCTDLTWRSSLHRTPSSKLSVCSRFWRNFPWNWLNFSVLSEGNWFDSGWLKSTSTLSSRMMSLHSSTCELSSACSSPPPAILKFYVFGKLYQKPIKVPRFSSL